MNSCFSFSRGGMMAAVALAVLPLAQAKIERVVEKSFTVSAAGTVKIETSGGEIQVEPSPDVSTVRVIATQRFNTDSESEADEIAKGFAVTIERSGNDVNAKASRAGRSSDSWTGIFNWGKQKSVRVDFKVTVPAEFAVVAKTLGGDLIIGDMKGAVNVSTSGGDVELGRLGSMVDAKTSGGDIDLKAAAGDVRLTTSGGDIEAGRVDGRAELSTSGGDIEIDAVQGALSAHTSGGNVRAGFVGALSGDNQLSTSGGNVSVELDKAAAFTLDAHTMGGNVSDNGFAIVEKERRKNRLAGDVNGGGSRLKLHSSGGNITVRAR